MAKTRLFGESISPEVVKQLERRAEVLSRGIRNSNDLRYLNEKTSWVRMISGVDTQDAENNFTSEEAKGFILSGGELEWDGKRFIRRRGFNTGNNEEERGRYNYDKDLGIRPEAGITSFSIKHIGTYGVLREADINFNVWTRKDLEKAQNLYLRPGMSVIVEWGNSIYLDDNGNTVDTLSLPNAETFFRKSKPSSIVDLVSESRANNFYNYDAFLGFIVNFSWSFRTDGGYDCSLKLISKGAVLESITTSKSAFSAIRDFNGVFPEQFVNDDKEVNKSYLHYILNLFSKVFGPIDNNFIKEYSENYVNQVNKETNDPGRFFNFEYSSNDGKETAYYISLNTLCSLINIGFIFKNPAGDRITSFYSRTEGSNVVEPQYVTFEDHFSLNPLYCILPKIPKFSNKVKLPGITESIIDIENNKSGSILSIYVNLSEIVKDLNAILDGTKTPDKANVFDFMNRVLQKVQSYLGEINDFSLSYDEDLEKWIIVDRNAIVNTSTDNTSSNKGIEILKVTGLNSTVLDVSLVTKITPQLTSQIAISAQATKINSPDINLSLTDWNANVVDRFASREEELVFAEDQPKSELVLSTKRLKEARRTGKRIPIYISREELEQEKNEEKEKADLKKYLQDIEDAYASLEPPSETEQQKKYEEAQFKNTTPTYNITALSSKPEIKLPPVNLNTVPNYDKELFDKKKSDSYVRFSNAVYGNSGEDSSTVANNGLIPIELNLKIDGVSGIKIGQIFRIGTPEAPSNILPSVYNEYGFVVSGVDSTLENSKWVTTLRGLTFKVENTNSTAKGRLTL